MGMCTRVLTALKWNLVGFVNLQAFVNSLKGANRGVY